LVIVWQRPEEEEMGPTVRRESEGVVNPGRTFAVAVVALLLCPLAAAASRAQTPSAIRVEVPNAPQRVHGTDGREHIEYDVVISNAFTAEATLTSLEVRGGGRQLLSLSGAALRAATLRVGTSEPTEGRIPSGSTVVTQVDVVLPSSAGRTVPSQLSNRITYTIPATAPARPVIGATTIETPAVRVDRRRPVVIASPLRGTGWLNGNGCCADPTSPHRQVILSMSNGRYVKPEIFAIDWVRAVDGLLFTGDGSKNTDWPTYGARLYAVANGTVVSAIDNLPDIPPFENNPDLRTPRDFAGNSVQLRIGPGRYACYAHLKPGSLRVRRGQRVRVGQVIGLVGNSGNTTASHLHFGIQRRPDCLSKNEPFEIDRFTLEGNVDPATAAPPRVTVIGPRRRLRRSHPLITSVATFLPPVRPRSATGRRCC
jgi:murein DD-endopeptidase MepM/ murein hydrolase activator NlpD